MADAGPPPPLTERQMRVARIVKLLSSVVLTGFAIVGMLSLVGIPGTGLKLWIGGVSATAVSVYLYFNDHKYPRSR
jgi:hypothetical protein